MNAIITTPLILTILAHHHININILDSVMEIIIRMENKTFVFEYAFLLHQKKRGLYRENISSI